MDANRPCILIVDDETENLRALERTLKSRFEIVSATSGTQALGLLQSKEYAVVISDQRMPGCLGTDLLAQVAKIQPLTKRIILTAFTETKEILDAINRAEIYRYITKPWENTELLANVSRAVDHFLADKKNQDLLAELTHKESELRELNRNLEKTVEIRTLELKQANERLSEQAMTDPLTRLLNRRAFSQKLNEEVERSSRYRRSIAFAMIDVDHFKTFNDMEGHLAGDEALRKLSRIFASSIRKSDVLARYGGEEFILMMPETNISQAVEICQRLRHSVENAVFQGKKGEAYLTVSIGISAFPEDATTPEELIEVADKALYQAKESGRNRVMH